MGRCDLGEVVRAAEDAIHKRGHHHDIEEAQRQAQPEYVTPMFGTPASVYECVCVCGCTCMRARA